MGMTREEQIDWLCQLRADLNNGIISTPWNKEFTEALNKVLEQSCEDWCDVPSDEMTLEQARQAVKDLRKKLAEHLEQESVLKTVINEEEAEAYPISKNIIKGFEEFTKKMFKQGQPESNGCEVKVITRGNCIMCGKELDEDEGLLFCKECEAKAIKGVVRK